MYSSVSSRYISVILQGPLFRQSQSGDGAALAIESIKKYLPDAEIIVSTWRGEETDGLSGVSKFIISDLPDALVDSTGNINNFNRQLTSTLKGLNEATRTYVLKMRADHRLEGTQLFTRPSRVNKQTTHGLLSRKITVTNYFVRDPLKVPFLFHISDLIQFGTKADMVNLWTSSCPENASLLQNTEGDFPRIFGNFAGNSSFREAPEQTLMRLWLAREGLDVDLLFPCHTSFQLFGLWEKVLTANFSIIDFNASGVKYPQRFASAFLGSKTILTEKSFRAMQRNPGSKTRYANLLFAKYITCWFIPRYWLATGNVVISRLMPGTARAIRIFLRSRMGLTHPDRY